MIPTLLRHTEEIRELRLTVLAQADVVKRLVWIVVLLAVMVLALTYEVVS